MKKISPKSVLVGLILILVLVLTVFGITTARTYLSSASGGEEPTGLKIESSETSAVLSWSTEKPVMARVSYGSAPASLLLQSDLRDSAEASTTHSVTLSSLRPGQNYYFNIKVGEAVYDNGGIPYSFKTKVAKVAESEPTVAGIATTTTPLQTVTPSPMPVLPTAVPTRNGTGACLQVVDYNKDGTINSLDILFCRQAGGVVAVPSVASTSAQTDCKSDVDYNNDGTINSLDILTCRSR